jgi:hypothetical protein
MSVTSPPPSIPASSSDFCVVNGSGAEYCGMGAYLDAGGNSNGISIKDFWPLFIGVGRSIKDTDIYGGGYTIYDLGLQDNFQGCYAQDGNGPAYRTSVQSSATFLACASENGILENGILKHIPDLFQGNNLIIRRISPGSNPSGHVTVIDPNYGQNINTINTDVTPNVRATSGCASSDPAFVDSHASWESLYNNLHWEYQAHPDKRPYDNFVVAGKGWWGRAYGPYKNRIFLGESQYPAEEGPGHWRDYWGHFAGLSDPYFLGRDINSITNQEMRGGQQKVGDRFLFKIRDIMAYGMR